MKDKITVYKLLEAAELINQRNTISNLVAGLSTPNTSNNLISFKIDEKGFFSMKNKIVDLPSIVPTNVPKTEEIAIQKAGELLNGYSSKLRNHPTLSNLFQGLKASYASSKLHEKGYGIKEWDVHYQLHVKNEDNSQNGSKPVNGMSVTVKIANHGKLIGIDYNMRPIKENIQSRRYKVSVETQKEIEPETELLYISSLTQGVIAPFYNTLSYKSAPACVEAENMLHTAFSRSTSLASPISTSSNIGEPGINLNKLVWRIGSEDNTPYFELTDESGLALKYEKEEKDYYGNDLNGSILLPEGAKVIQLKPSEKNENLIRTIAFWNGKYRDAFLDKKAFEKSNRNFSNNFSLQLFINDMEQLSYNLKTWNIDIHNYSILNKALKIINGFKSLAKDLDIEIFNNYVSEHTKKLWTNVFIENYKFDKGSYMNKLMNFLSPLFKDYINQNKIIVPPIDLDWIFANAERKRIYEQIIIGESGNASDFSGEVGDVKDINFSNRDEVPVFKKFYQKLAETVRSSESNDVEKWLKVNKTNIDNSEKIIVLGHDWFYLASDARYAGDIGVNLSLGNIMNNTSLIVILHELDQSSMNYFPTDSHISEEMTKFAFEELLKFNINEGDFLFKKNLRGDCYQVDCLYQSSTFLRIIYGALFISHFEI